MLRRRSPRGMFWGPTSPSSAGVATAESGSAKLPTKALAGAAVVHHDREKEVQACN